MILNPLKYFAEHYRKIDTFEKCDTYCMGKHYWTRCFQPIIININNSEIVIIINVHTRPVHKNIFLNFQKYRAVLCCIVINKQLLEKVVCSNIANSLSSGNHLFYKAEYMGRSCLRQVWAIPFDWSALAT